MIYLKIWSLKNSYSIKKSFILSGSVRSLFGSGLFGNNSTTVLSKIVSNSDVSKSGVVILAVTYWSGVSLFKFGLTSSGFKTNWPCKFLTCLCVDFFDKNKNFKLFNNFNK